MAVIDVSVVINKRIQDYTEVGAKKLFDFSRMNMNVSLLYWVKETESY